MIKPDLKMHTIYIIYTYLNKIIDKKNFKKKEKHEDSRN